MPPSHDPALSFPASSSTLLGTRLLLHRLEPQHAQSLLVYVQENRDWLAPWEPQHQQSYYTLSGQQQLLKAAQSYWQLGHGLLFGVFERQASKSTMAGRICLTRFPQNHSQALAGYSIAQKHSKKGYATEALRLLCLHATEAIGLKALQLAIMPHNLASVQVALKCGFKKQHHQHRLLEINHRLCSHDLFRLEAASLEKQPSAAWHYFSKTSASDTKAFIPSSDRG